MNNWIDLVIDVIGAAVAWMMETTVLGVPLLSIIMAITIIGIVIRLVLYRA